MRNVMTRGRPWSKHSVGSSKHFRKYFVPPPEPEEEQNQGKSEADDKMEAKVIRDSEKPKPNKDDADFEAFEEVASSNRFKGVSKKVDQSKLVESKCNGMKGKVVERKHVTFEDDDSDDDDLYQELHQQETEPEHRDFLLSSNTRMHQTHEDRTTDWRIQSSRTRLYIWNGQLQKLLRQSKKYCTIRYDAHGLRWRQPIGERGERRSNIQP